MSGDVRAVGDRSCNVLKSARGVPASNLASFSYYANFKRICFPNVHLKVLLIAVNIIIDVMALVPASMSVLYPRYVVKLDSKYCNPYAT